MNSQKTYLRFPADQRIEHLLLLISFTILAVTGLPQKFPTSSISPVVIMIFGGIEVARIIHRVAAAVLLIESVYHIIMIGYKLYIKQVKATMLPGIQDARDGIQAFGYNLGLAKSRPKMGRYGFEEKMEYWALIWGTVVMGITGFMLWNPIATAEILPGQFIPAAKAAHGGEAILAVLAIIVWHFYGVHIKTWNWSMIKGTISRHEMEEDHALELEEIENGESKSVKTSKTSLKKRKTIFFPIAAILSIALLAGLFWFVNLEVSALETLPPASQEQEVFSPRTLTPGEPEASLIATEAVPDTEAVAETPAQAAASGVDTWDSGIGEVFDKKCASCHGSAGDLSLENYADTMKGGPDGTVILPGDPEGSQVVTVQTAGDHMGQFSTRELERVVEWIRSGAPEK
ncbi:MAG: c-type cytochrome domain-containing protein [Anaerolineaceae bacterium]